ncbi:helix-turn-helix domain-containing protein [Microbacterium indicum]|uniref:helix-turn-helix domain-containing protein n=1 Tax=Microbacterium indicum TaxID=358100 RepID=UPI00041A1710|nr:helix-turn-helix transcriptional regulator [Microbacterium indicum]
MARTWDELRGEVALDEESVEAAKQRLRGEVNAHALRELRDAYGLTQQQLADRLGISQKRVSRIERGDVRMNKIDTLMRYAEAVGARVHIELETGESSVTLVA